MYVYIFMSIRIYTCMSVHMFSNDICFQMYIYWEHTFICFQHTFIMYEHTFICFQHMFSNVHRLRAYIAFDCKEYWIWPYVYIYVYIYIQIWVLFFSRTCLYIYLWYIQRVLMATKNANLFMRWTLLARSALPCSIIAPCR